MAKRFVLAIDTLNKWVGMILNYVLFLMLGITLFEVISRFAFSNPTIWAHETTGLLFGFYLIIIGGYVLLVRAHIKVDILWSQFSPRGRAIIDLITCGFAFAFVGVLLIFSISMAWDAIQIRETSISPFGPPVYHLKVCVVIGSVLLLLQLIAKTIRDIHLVVTGGEYV